VERLGEKHTKFFSDNIHGGKKQSLQCAIEYRDSIKQSAGAKYKTWRQSVIRKNNTSGIPGVACWNKQLTFLPLIEIILDTHFCNGE
jgi:hypothetical protein